MCRHKQWLTTNIRKQPQRQSPQQQFKQHDFKEMSSFVERVYILCEINPMFHGQPVSGPMWKLWCWWTSNARISLSFFCSFSSIFFLFRIHALTIRIRMLLCVRVYCKGLWSRHATNIAEWINFIIYKVAYKFDRRLNASILWLVGEIADIFVLTSSGNRATTSEQA